MARKRKQRHRRLPAIVAAAPPPIVNIAEKRALRDALQPGRKPEIFIAVPTTGGDVNFSLALLFARAMASNNAPDCPFRFTVHTEVGKRGPDYARNCIVKRFMEESDADWLYMIDADQVVPDNFWHLCVVRDADVVSAVTPVWVGNGHFENSLRYNAYELDDKHRCINLPIPATNAQPFRVPIVGTGALAIRRRVFAPRPHGVGIAPFYFTHEADRKVQAGEDVNFSVEVNRAGFVVAVHPGVRFDHMKNLPLWQVAEYYDARRKMEVDGAALSIDQRLSIG